MDDGAVIRPSPATCNPEVPTQKCAARRDAEARGVMYFNEQARGWVYPRLGKRLIPIETWEFCPFCLVHLPDDEVPRYAKQLPYRPPQQPDNPR